MIFTFLGSGTSQGVPMIGCSCAVCSSDDPRDKRLRTSLMVESDHARIVIDTGPDFRQQMLREQVTALNGIVFTHEHKDHIAGLDDVRAFNYLQQSSMSVFATVNVQDALHREFHYVFSGARYPGIPKIDLHTIDAFPFVAAGIELIPIPVFHLNLPVLGFRIGDFTYITDANSIPDSSMELIKGSRVLILNALRREKHVSHFTLDEALELIEILKPEQAFLTHLSHQMGKHADVESELPPHVRLAYDGLKISL